MALLGKFQTQGFKYWGENVGKANHLGEIFRLEPQRATDYMVQILALNYGRTLDTFLSRFPTKEFDTEDMYFWDIVASARRNEPLIEARDENGKVVTKDSENVGVGGAPFYLVFANKWFFEGDVIWGNLNQVYPIRVMEEPKSEGTNMVYKVYLFGGNMDGVPAERLLMGERFSRGYDPVENDFSRKVGGIHFNAPARMYNEFSTIRMHHKVGGAMLEKKIAVGIPIEQAQPNGRTTYTTTNMWMHNVDYVFEQEFNEMKNNVIAWGVSNRNENGEYFDFGKSGQVIRTGAGLMEQMEAGNTNYYNAFRDDFRLRVIEEALYPITYKLPLNERYVVLETGQWGADQFDKGAKREVSGWMRGPFELDNSSISYVRPTKNEISDKALEAGAQFVGWLGPNNVHVQIQVDNFYDDDVHNKILHPCGGVAYSYRYDLMSLATENGLSEPNIFKCGVKNRPEYRGYQWGLRNPYTGQMNNDFMSFDEDAAVIHRMATLGVCVLDPLRTMSLIPSVLG